MIKDKPEYLRKCILMVEECRSKLEWCWNGLLIEYAPSSGAEYAAYKAVVNSFRPVYEMLTEIIEKYAILSVRGDL